MVEPTTTQVAPTWTDIMTACGTVGSAIVTVFAVIVALCQSKNAKKDAAEARKDAERTRKEILQTRKDELTPIVILDWGESSVGPSLEENVPHEGDLKTIVFRVTNVGRAPALDVTVEIYGYGTTSGIPDERNPQMSIPMPRIHLAGGQSIDLMKEFDVRVVMPQTLRIKMSYSSVLGTRYTSDWCTFKPRHRERVLVVDYMLPSSPITEPPTD